MDKVANSLEKSKTVAFSRNELVRKFKVKQLEGTGTTAERNNQLLIDNSSGGPHPLRNRRRQSEHRHQIIKEKLQVITQDNYYKTIPLQPGFLFLDTLLKAPRVHIHTLKINIPDSLYNTDKQYYIRTSDSGKLIVTTDISNYSFLQKLEEYKTNNGDIYDEIASILRMSGENTQDMEQVVFNRNQFHVKMTGREHIPRSLFQRYIKSAGHRPSVTRLYYYPSTKQNKTNFAYFVSSLDLERSGANDIQRCVVDISHPERLEVFKMAGRPLKALEKEAGKIVKYLDTGYNVRIQEIVLDFVRDTKGVSWLIGCKRVLLDPSTTELSLKPVVSWWPDLHLSEKSHSKSVRNARKSKGMKNYFYCKLCRIDYSWAELHHWVSVRMLVLYKNSVSFRTGITWDKHYTEIATKDMLSQSVRICQYCYMLVTSELELISLKRNLANLVNIPVEKYEHERELDLQLQFLPKELIQWRVLVFATRIFEYNLLPLSEKLYFHIRFHSAITSYKLSKQVETESEYPCLTLNIPRMYYFFSRKGSPVKELIMNSELEIRITIGKSYTRRVICNSTSKILATFPPNSQTNEAIVEGKILYLTDKSNNQLGVVHLYSGISCDKAVKKEYVNTTLTRYEDAYLPKDSYATSDPLPGQWMEIFGEYETEEPTFRNLPRQETLYTPLIKSQELLGQIGSKSPSFLQSTNFTSKLITQTPQKLKKSKSTMKRRKQTIEKKDTEDFISTQRSSSHSNGSSAPGSPIKAKMKSQLPLIYNYMVMSTLQRNNLLF